MSKIIANEISSMLPVTRKVPVRQIADRSGMIMGSCSLTDGSSLKLIADNKQFNAVIMKHGNVLSAKGVSGTKKKISKLIENIYLHLTSKNRLKDNVAEDGLINFIDNFERSYNVKKMPQLHFVDSFDGFNI